MYEHTHTLTLRKWRKEKSEMAVLSLCKSKEAAGTFSLLATRLNKVQLSSYLSANRAFVVCILNDPTHTMHKVAGFVPGQDTTKR